MFMVPLYEMKSVKDFPISDKHIESLINIILDDNILEFINFERQHDIIANSFTIGTDKFCSFLSGNPTLLQVAIFFRARHIINMLVSLEL